MPSYNHLDFATTIDPYRGIPSGFSSWQTYLDLMNRYVDEEMRGVRTPIPNFNLAQRVSEARRYSVIEREGLPLSFVVTAAEDPPEEKKRTLLSILWHIRKNKKTLTERSHCWKWLYTEYRNQRYRQERNPERFNPAAEAVVMISIESFLELANKYIKPLPNEELIFLANPTSKMISRKFATRYWSYGGRGELICNYSQIPKEDYVRVHRMKEVDGEFYTPECFTEVWYKTKDRGFTYTSMVLRNNNKQENCPACRKIWEKGSLAYSHRLEEICCPACHTHDNPKHTERYIFGGYHGRRDSWKFLIAKVDKETSIPMGIEIEMQNKYSCDEVVGPKKAAWEIYQAQIALNPSWNEFYTERDGSLYSGGLELVSNPMTLEFAQLYWAKMLPEVRKHCVGWNVTKYNGNQPNSYGIHLTVSRKYVSDYQAGRLYKFIENKHNQNFLQCVAQRVYNYSGSNIADGSKRHLAGNVSFKSPGKLGHSANRYSSMNIKDTLIEFRMFASTLNNESFLKNYEFIDALWYWCKETAFSIKHEDFLTWLSNKQGAFKRYPNLLSYLNKDHFFVRTNGPKAIKFENLFKKNMKFSIKGTLILPIEIDPTSDPQYLQDIEQCVS